MSYSFMKIIMTNQTFVWSQSLFIFCNKQFCSSRSLPGWNIKPPPACLCLFSVVFLVTVCTAFCFHVPVFLALLCVLVVCSFHNQVNSVTNSQHKRRGSSHDESQCPLVLSGGIVRGGQEMIAFLFTLVL